jgi:pimeloyl-ACP methyl ester carboxylesterase
MNLKQSVKQVTIKSNRITIREAGMDKVRSSDGTEIAYNRTGSGPPLVLVHGGTADHTRWSPVLPSLEQHFAVYAIDRRGRGGSGDTDPYAIEREFEDVAAVVDAIGGPVVLLGHSFGAVCSLQAVLLTTNIRKIILYEPPPSGFSESPETLARMQAHLDSGDREGLLSTFLLEAAGLTAEELEIMRSVPAWQGRVAAAHTILRELKSIEALPPFDAERFRQLKIPTLLLQGGESSALYKDSIETIHAMLPDSRIVVMPGQQHIAMNTAPDLFVREVLTFLLDSE